MAITVGGPGIEIVIIVPGNVEIGVQLVGPAEPSRLAGVYRERRASARDFALAVANLDDGRGAIFIDGDSVNTGPQNGKCKIGRVDLKILVAGQTLHPHA